MRIRQFRSLLIMAVLTSLPSSRSILHAQSTASVSGQVTDQSGAAIPGVHVTLENVATTAKLATTSQSEGSYAFPFVQPGVYSLSVEKAGFQPALINNINVEVSMNVRQNVSLKVSSATEQVTVTEQAPGVSVDSAALGQVIKAAQIESVPLQGRNFLGLATLSAGVNPPSYSNGQSAAQGFGNTRGERGDLVISISGVREISTVYLFDGVPSKQQFYGAVGFQPPPDSIEEFNIQRGYLPTEFGPPAVVNVVTKSGTNQVHGSVWEFLRNDAMDARNFFDVQKPSFRENIFGFSAGGPIVPNRLFWFGDYEGTRLTEGITSYAVVPTEAMLNGDFSGSSTIVKDPSTGVPFPNNIIPASYLSPFAKTYNQVIPTQNMAPQAALGGANLVGAPVETVDTNKFQARVDYAMSEKDLFFGRFAFMNSGYEIGSIFPYNGTTNPLDSRNAVFAWTHTFSPSVVNSLRLALDRSSQAQGGPIQKSGEPYWPDALGLSNLNQIPECNAPPDVAISGQFTAGVGNANCIFPSNTNKMVIDNMSFIRGKHTFTVGGQLVRLFYRDVASIYGNGYFVYTGQYSGDPLADYLLGDPYEAIGARPSSPMYLQGWQTDLYANDDFHVRPNLTINMGIRWQFANPMVEKYNNLAIFDPVTGQLDFAGQGGTPRGLLSSHYLDFAPRFGFAYSPTKNWAIRSSYGIFYDTTPGNDLAWNGIKAPFNLSTTFVGGTTPTIDMSQLFPGQTGNALPAGTNLFNLADRKDPYLQQWTFSIQRSLPWRTTLEIAYVGSKGTHLSKREDINRTPLPTPEEAATIPLQQRRPYPQYGYILDDLGIANSEYEGLQTTFRKNFSNGLNFQIGYTWARSMDDDSYDSRAERNYRAGDMDHARSIFDIRHRFVATFLYQIPFLSDAPLLARGVFGGWELSGVLSFQTGLPFMPLDANDPSNTGANVISWPRPNRTCNGNLPASQQTPSHWFDTSCFSEPAPYTYGNAGVNFLDTNGVKSVDLALTKQFHIFEKQQLEVRGEFFNAFNEVNFGLPGFVMPSPSFGVVTSALPARIVQVAMKYRF